MTNLTDTTGTWQIDPTHTTIGFSVRHAGTPPTTLST